MFSKRAGSAPTRLQIEVIVLLFLLHRANPGRAERREPEDRVQAFEDFEPARNRLVGHLQILAQGVDRKRRAHQIGKSQHEQFESAEILDALEAGDVVVDQAIPVVARPPLRLDLGSFEEGLGKSGEPEQIQKLWGLAKPQLGDRKRVKPKVVIPALKRIAAVAVEIEARAAGDQNLLAGVAGIK